jgi:linoleoyl-CoA desaturase
MAKVKFVPKEKKEFFAAVKKRVDEYFKENDLSKNANADMYIKSFICLGGVVVFYALIISGIFSPWQMLILAVFLGAFQAFTAFNIGHDAIHGAYSSSSRVNKFMSIIGWNILGANDYMWAISHNVAHHTYTNIAGHDEDTAVAPGLIRLSPADKRNWLMRYQHYYAFILYSLASINWVFKKDYVKFFSPQIGGSVETKNHPKKELLNLFFFKFVYYTLFIAVPLYFLDITVGQFIIGFVAMHLAEGLVLGLVFQLAHVVEGTEFPEPDEQGTIQENWAVHQMCTTANFAIDSKLANFFCGGLNMQVEHHLFPNVCHIHYPALSKIVRETAEEHNVPYIVNDTFIGALKSHYKMLKKFGQADEVKVGKVAAV